MIPPADGISCSCPHLLLLLLFLPPPLTCLYKINLPLGKGRGEEGEEGTQFVFQGSKKGEEERKRDFPWGGIRRSTLFSPPKTNHLTFGAEHCKVFVEFAACVFFSSIILGGGPSERLGGANKPSPPGTPDRDSSNSSSNNRGGGNNSAGATPTTSSSSALTTSGGAPPSPSPLSALEMTRC